MNQSQALLQNKDSSICCLLLILFNSGKENLVYFTPVTLTFFLHLNACQFTNGVWHLN